MQFFTSFPANKGKICIFAAKNEDICFKYWCYYEDSVLDMAI